MDERIKFIGRVLDGEKISALCEEFGISRKTGYKIYERYKSCGVEGLTASPLKKTLCKAARNELKNLTSFFRIWAIWASMLLRDF
jgi:transposase